MTAARPDRPDQQGAVDDGYSDDRQALVAALAREGIEDRAVLDAIARVPRHLFVPSELADQSYADHALPIGEDQTISQPFIVAYMTEALGVETGARVLEVGTGSGYQAAVLAEMGLRVFTVEIVAALAKRADALLTALHYDSIVRRVGDGYAGWAEHAPYDGVLVTAAAPYVPGALLDQLASGGRLVIPLNDEGADAQWIWVLEKRANGDVVKHRTIRVRFVPMTGAIERLPN